MAAYIAFASLCAPAPALAQQPDGTSRAAARALGYAGVQDYQSGEFSAASDKLERAYAVTRAPAVGLWSARALVKLGKLVEAAERYLEVTRLDPNTGDVAIQLKAQADAEKERVELLPRIPSLTIAVKGADEQALELTLDGRSVPNALIGQPLPVNPGTHRLKARMGEREATDERSVEEGGSATLTLTFAAPTPKVAAEPGGEKPRLTAPIARARSAEADDSRGSGSARLRNTLGWVAVSVGGAGLVTSGVTLGLALGKKSDLEDDCSGSRCSPAVADEVSSYSSLRNVSTISAIVGVVGVGGGLVLLLTGTSGGSTKEAEAVGSILPWIGLGSAGVRGAF